MNEIVRCERGEWAVKIGEYWKPAELIGSHEDMRLFEYEQTGGFKYLVEIEETGPGEFSDEYRSVNRNRLPLRWREIVRVWDARLPEDEANKYREYDRILTEMKRLNEEMNLVFTADIDQRPSINSPADAYNLIRYQMDYLDHEELWVLLLNTRNRVIKQKMILSGSLNSAQVRVGEVFKSAIVESAFAIIVVHNHPSGDPTPSPDDVAITRAMVEAGKLLDIQVLDHLVIGQGRFVSLKERGLGF